MKRLALVFSVVGCAALVACNSIGIGVSLPIGRAGSIGVGATSDGTVSGGVGVGGRAGSVGVGGSARLPPKKAEPAASAASASQ